MTSIRRPVQALAAAGASASLIVLSAGPGMAASSVARASATALRVTVAGTPTDSGSYTVSNDGKKQTSTGTNKPALQALGNQSFISTGTLAQDATTAVVNGRGRAAACAGLAGDGATLVAAGTSNCLTPGKNLDLSAGTFKISGVKVLPSDITMGIDQQILGALAPVIAPTQDAIKTALRALGNPTLSLNLGAVQSKCLIAPGRLTGDSDLANVALQASIAGNNVTLVKLPVHPAPNTKLVTGLDKVVSAFEDALDAQFTKALDGNLSQLPGVTDTIIDTINDNVIKAIAPQLAPLEDNVISGTLNEQKRGNGKITVTALDLHVLPAAQSAAGLDALSVQIGESSCGPIGKVAVRRPTPKPKPTHNARVPRSVPAGLASGTSAPTDASQGDRAAQIILIALAGASVVGGVTTYRRLRRP